LRDVKHFLGLDLKNLRRSLEIIRKQFQKFEGTIDWRSGISAGARISGRRRADEGGLERTSSRNPALGSSILSYGKMIDPLKVHTKVRSVTPQEVLEFASKLLDPKKITLAAVGPVSDASILTN
jgi:predicted Zn-dependent peptidase